MMNASKIQLSAEEWQLVQNSDWILTKHAIIGKVYQLFGQLADHMRAGGQPPAALPEAVWRHAPKISKGEQYRQLPWVVLDYPRHFTREEVFAIRSFFWWGHYFSCTLHLKGSYQRQLAPAIIQEAAAGTLAGYYWSAGGGEFDFDVQTDHYTAMDKRIPTLAEAQGGDFLKLTVIHPLEEWDTVQERLLAAYLAFVNMAAR